MKLILDIGNSSVNWANEKKSKFISQGSFVYDKKNFENSLEKNIVLTKSITKILVSNVAGQEIRLSLKANGLGYEVPVILNGKIKVGCPLTARPFVKKRLMVYLLGYERMLQSEPVNWERGLRNTASWFRIPDPALLEEPERRRAAVRLGHRA